MNFSTIFLIQIIITILFSICAAIFDVRKNYVPDLLCYVMVVFGLGSNLILSVISNNIKFILASFISMVITYTITYLLWKLEMWGGGDVRLFTGIATVIPSGLNIDFLNIFPVLSIYPFSFSVVVNSILVSFPFLVIFVTYVMIKKDMFKSNTDILFNIFNVNSLKIIMDNALNKTVPINDLKEGDIMNNYYFSNGEIKELIDSLDGNLEVHENKDDDEFKYYFKSFSAGGLTSKDVIQLKIMQAQGILKKDASVKISYPYTPAIVAGLMIAVFYGDIMMLVTKNLALVI
ncbi:MAG: prepilin peptidase [Methanobrevibacter sp.]|nr:prepilin peptidase [Methanobrevibacter sp.]